MLAVVRAVSYEVPSNKKINLPADNKADFMCRYAYKTYKSHFACFKCHKTFKQATFTDILDRVGKLDYSEKLRKKPANELSAKESAILKNLDATYKRLKVKCPQCGGYMADLGLDFKSPKKTALKEWKIIECLFRVGKCFYSCGCTGIGYIPQKRNDYLSYLEHTLKEYEQSLKYYQNSTKEDYPDRSQRIKYWGDKIKLIKAELSKRSVA